MEQRWLGIFVFALVAALGCGSPPHDPGTEVTGLDFPPNVAGLALDEGLDEYDRESIYGYIDGHAEVYLAYGMKRCLSRRYRSPDGADEIIIDLFEMASPADAFGVFSHDRDGEVVAVGQGGVVRHGWLSFWSGAWYGSIYSSGGTDAAKEAVVDVGRAVAAALPEDGGEPGLVRRLPVEGLDAASVCFLRSPQILNAHIFVGNDNVLGLGPEVEAVVGKYLLDGNVSHLIVVHYPSEELAKLVVQRAGESGDSDFGPLPVTMGREGALIAIVVGDDIGELGETLLEQALGGKT